MWRQMVLTVCLSWSAVAAAAEVTDATGRSVAVPDHVQRVIAAGPPASVLLESLAPDLMLGWPGPLPGPARAVLPAAAASLRQSPRLTGRQDVADKIAALHPDLIIDYGEVTPRYRDLAIATQQKTGVPTLLLDGDLPQIPAVLRTLGRILHRDDRADTIARFAEALLTLPAPDAHPTVLYARGPTGGFAAAPGTDVTAVFARLGWTVLAPEGQGTFRPVTVATVAALDPDWLVFADPAMTEVLAKDPAWPALRAVRAGHAVVAPHLPFGWVEEPPSINRLIGLAWLSGHDPALLAAVSNAALYGRALTSAERDSLVAGTITIQP